MKKSAIPLETLRMGRRSFLSGATALGVGAGLSACGSNSDEPGAEVSDISVRDQDLRFIC